MDGLMLVYLVGLLLPPPPEYVDLEFMRRVEVWVGSQPGFRLDAHLPSLYQALTAPRYWVRKEALARVRAQGHLAFRDLALAATHPDPNIALAAAACLDRIYACGPCGGTGLCPHCTPATTGDCPRCDQFRNCRACDGAGDRRYFRRYNLDAATKYLAERSPFP